MFIIGIFENTFAGLGSLFAFILIIALVSNACHGNATTTKTGNEVIEDTFQTTETTIPVATDLASLHIFGSHSNVLDNIDNGSVVDAYGNTYNGPYFDLCSYGNYVGEPDTQAYTDLVAGGHYQYLTGTFFARPEQAESYTIEFFIFADDKLVYSSGPINRRTQAIDFTVDIQNCNVIRVMSLSCDYTAYGTNPGIELVNAQVHN